MSDRARPSRRWPTTRTTAEDVADVVSFDAKRGRLARLGIFGLPHTPEEARVVLIPVPFGGDLLVRSGTADGPRRDLEATGRSPVSTSTAEAL